MDSLIVIALLFVFLPTVIALLRSHPSWMGIFVTNVFFGWSGIGWIIALIWSLSACGPSKRKSVWGD